MNPVCDRVGSDGGESYLDRILRALSHPRRRLLLYYLRENDPVDIEDAAAQIAAWERGETPDDVPEEAKGNVLTSLYHGHVPKLTKRGIVDYDQRSGAIRFQDPPEELETLLELARSIDDQP